MPFEKFEKLAKEKQDMILSVGINQFSQQSYNDVSTDVITRKCGISKGILFHYFGSKKGFYMYCLEKSMERLTTRTETVSGTDFYEILFESISKKMSVCMNFKDEMHMVNMASRDASKDIRQIKADVMARYKQIIQAESISILSSAVSTLQFKDRENSKKMLDGLYLYINALLNRYLAVYQNTPDKFFENSALVKEEMKEYLDVMLYGICQ